MESIRKNPGLYMVEGVLLIILGTLAIIMPIVSTISIALIIGWLLIIGGIYRLFRTIKLRNEKIHFWLSLLSSIAAIIFGTLLLTNIAKGLFVLTVLLAIFFLIDGAASIILALNARPSGYWGWFLFSGVLTIILAFLILSGLPYAAFWVPGLLLGINLIMTGFSLTFAAASTGIPVHRVGT